MQSEYEYRLKRSPVPIMTALAAVVLYAAVFMAAGYPEQVQNLWLHIPAALIFAGTVSKTVSFFFPIRRVRAQKQYLAPTSGIPDIDRQLKEADAILRDAEKLAVQIRPVNGTLAAAVGRLTGTGRKILEYAAVNTQKTTSLHRFFTYYLPTLGKLLRNYILFENHAADTAGVQTTKQEIEDAVCAMEEVFTKQLEKLFDDTTLDITTDIDVLENVMTGDIGENFTKQKPNTTDKDIKSS